jgi:hypothetical protein
VQPQPHPGRLDGLVDHGQQLALESVQVDLLAQVGGEAGHGAGGVEAAPVEAAVDQVLDPAAQRGNAAAAAKVAPATARLPASPARRVTAGRMRR